MKSKTSRALKITKAIVAGLVLASIAFLSVLSLANAVGNGINIRKAKVFDEVIYEDKLVPQKDDNGHWTFTTDRDFKLMQVTDVHLGGGTSSFAKDLKALNAVAAMASYEKPDLLVVTGDLAFATTSSLNLNNKVVFRMFAEMMEALGVYWTISFGNHDTEWYNFYSRNSLSKAMIKMEMPHFLYTRNDTAVEGENHIIKVLNSAGVVSQAIFMIDSNSYPKNKKQSTYDNIHEDQIAWYREQIAALNAYNVDILEDLDEEVLPAPKSAYETVKSLLFIHIPLQEYRTAWNEYLDNGEQDTADTKYIYGGLGEPVCCSEMPDTMFETMLELDSTKAVFCGHDHVNDFSLDYKGIRLSYSKSIDYIAYKDIDKKGTQRGCTVVVSDNRGEIEIRSENYYQDKYTTKYGKEIVNME